MILFSLFQYPEKKPMWTTSRIQNVWIKVSHWLLAILKKICFSLDIIKNALTPNRWRYYRIASTLLIPKLLWRPNKISLGAALDLKYSTLFSFSMTTMWKGKLFFLLLWVEHLSSKLAHLSYVMLTPKNKVLFEAAPQYTSGSRTLLSWAPFFNAACECVN